MNFLEKHHFLLRRLHSLTGIVPIGVFLIAHLTTNSTILWGAANGRADGFVTEQVAAEVAQPTLRAVGTFQEEVEFINGLPALLLIEITLWVSIAFHSVLGVYYATTGKRNTTRYAYQDNWRYTLQRWSGYIGILFVFYHIATLRWGWTFLVPGGAKWDHHHSASTLAAAMQGSTEGMTAVGFLVSLLYFVGVSMLVFHFANGLWTAAITWGITISKKAQDRWGWVCGALGGGLMAAGWASVVGFALLDYDDAYLVESSMQGNEVVAAPADDDDDGVKTASRYR
ncbi:MAG: hypothetical protein AAF108_10420 [Planctomycetota bacterium]